jgi:hypothetical protein
VDGFDPECRSRIDNDEGSFATGVPGDNIDPLWYDCFFDSNSGGGDDECHYRAGCMTGELAADDLSCASTQPCIEFCTARTPNGCDCFGCCSVLHAGSLLDVFITSSCSLDALDDDVACPRCFKTPICENALGTCELALAMPVADLPTSCTDTPRYECDTGTRCGPDVGDCAATQFCSNGCCLVDIVP